MTNPDRHLPPSFEPAQRRERWPIGELLVAGGKLARPKLDEALRLQRRWGVLLGKVLLSCGWIAETDFFEALAAQRGMRFVDLAQRRPDAALLSLERLADYNRLAAVPWRVEHGRTVIAAASHGPELQRFAERTCGRGGFEIAVATPGAVLHALQQRFDGQLTRIACDGLFERKPEFSARSRMGWRGLATSLAVLGGLLGALYLAPAVTLVALNLVLALFYAFIVVLRLVLIWGGAHPEAQRKTEPAELAALGQARLPVYTVLVPMYREPDSLPILASALRRLDYPRAKLDVKLLLEADDTETLDAAQKLGLESEFQVVRVPASLPRTKPKALNYGLQFALGEYLTIYDAEDMPDPDQLKKAVAIFRKAPPETACVQARLNYYNRGENWLTRMFTLEYSMWFDLLLPGLEQYGVPMPLGGTSNHFKTRVLRELGAWDPYNVTEDADLGVRLQQQGYRSEMVDSTTFEEAAHEFGNWIRQRSRWVKGYLQTWLVHMRDPAHLYRRSGPVGFWGFQLFVGAPMLALLVNPWLWAVFAACQFGFQQAFEALFPPWVLEISLFNFLFGNGAMIYFFMLGGLQRRYWRLLLYALSAPLYWALMSLAAYRGLWQLLRNPFFWEKTRHGHSDAARQMARAVS